MRTALAGTLARIAPWGAVAVQLWVQDRLLGRHGRGLSAYDDLHARLVRVEQTLERLELAPPAADLAGEPVEAMPGRRDPAPGAGSSRDAIVYRTVTLKNGARFEVALDRRRGDPIAEAVALGHHWFLGDFYALLDLMRPGDTVLDVGGHIGTFALAAAALGCRVLCIEAAPDNVRLLQAGVAQNGFEQMVVVHGAATDHEGSLEFFPNGPWGTITNAAAARAPSLINASRLTPVAIPALTVDALLARLRWERVDLVKIDIEGSEVAAIRGMAALLSRPDGPILLYESNAHALAFFGETPRGLAATLQRFGYTSYIVEPGRLVPTRPDDFRPECVANCLAVKGRPPGLAGRSVTVPRSRAETIRKILSESRIPRAQNRAHLARVLAEADAAVVSDPRVRHVLRLLSDDADDAVRAAASWSLTTDRRTSLGAPGRP